MPNTVRQAHGIVAEGSGQNARATSGAGILPAAKRRVIAQFPRGQDVWDFCGRAERQSRDKAMAARAARKNPGRTRMDGDLIKYCYQEFVLQ